MRYALLLTFAGLALSLGVSQKAQADTKGCITIQAVTYCGDDIPDHPTFICTDAASCDGGANSDPTPPDEAPGTIEDDPPATTVTPADPGSPASAPETPATTPQAPASPPASSAGATPPVAATPVTTTASVPAAPVPPPLCSNHPDFKSLPAEGGWIQNPDGTCSNPPRGLYCHVVDGTWKMEDLQRDQELSDPQWVNQGPWKDAVYDSATGVGSCNFPPDPPRAPANVTAAPPSQLGRLSQRRDDVLAQGFLLWDNTRFRSWQEFISRLISRGGSEAQFAERHPQAAEDLRALG